MPDRRKIHVISALMAEDVRQEISGMHSVIGLLSGKMVVGGLPVVMPKLVFRIEYESNETFSADCRLTLLSPTENRALTVVAHARIDKDLRNIFVGGWTPVQFTELGRYSVLLQIGDQQERSLNSFEIVAAQPNVVSAEGPPALNP